MHTLNCATNHVMLMKKQTKDTALPITFYSTRKQCKVSHDMEWLEQYKMEPRYGYEKKQSKPASHQRLERSDKKQKCMLPKSPTISPPGRGPVRIVIKSSSSEQKDVYSSFELNSGNDIPSKHDCLEENHSVKESLEFDDVTLKGLEFI